MENNADFVFVFGETNDYGHGAIHLGSPEKEQEDTFCTQLNLLMKDLIKKYGKDKLCFILPSRGFGEDPVACKGSLGDELGAALADYVEAMRKIISFYKVDYIDLYNNGFPKPTTDLGDEYTVDGLHPNDRGYALVAERVLEYIQNKK